MERGARPARGGSRLREGDILREPKKKIPDVTRRIFGEDREIGVRYVPSPVEAGVRDDGSIDAGLLERIETGLRRALSGESHARRTLVGPQRDELFIELGGRAASAHASAGEQRRVALVLVMAALELAFAGSRGATILLFDDVEAEFDEERLDRVFGFLHESAIQTLVATSKASLAYRYQGLGTLLGVERGAVRRVEPHGEGARS